MPGSPRLDGVVILVVEDDPDSRELAKRVLENQGASVIAAGTGTEALRIVEKTPPDVLLSDIWLPEMDGYTLMEKIRRLDHKKPIAAAAVSAYTSVEARHQSMAAGFQFHISKPLDVTELLMKVAILAGRGGSGPDSQN